MTRRGHYKTGIGVSFCAASAVLWIGYPPVYATITMVLAMASAALPDDMEIKWWRRGERHSVIPHRTLTHWLAPWLVMLVWIAQETQSNGVSIAFAALFGLVSGAIGHILMDWLTPMGVPVLSPFRRQSLHMIHSGNRTTESVVALLSFGVGSTLLFLSLA